MPVTKRARLRAMQQRDDTRRRIAKTPTGIAGFDEITFGGLPRGRPTLVCGGAGCGKTLFALEFIVRGARDFDEPGVFLSFEETTQDLIENGRSLGFDLPRLIKQRRVALDHARLDRAELPESGTYDLEGLFIRLGHAIASVGAKRVVLDTIETLFAGLSNQQLVRQELVRLFHWLKEKGVTAIVTGERSGDLLTRHGLEEFVSDCVVLLDQRVADQTATRRLRVVKYRGSAHSPDEVPFLIDEHGVSVLPLGAQQAEYPAPRTTVSTGVEDLDAMIEKGGVYAGSGILVSGPSGTGKSSLAAHFAAAAAARGERCLYFAFEESAQQIIRNMGSIGLRLDRLIARDLLRIEAAKPATAGLEAHLARLLRHTEMWRAKVVVLDPVSNLTTIGDQSQVKGMLSRLVHVLKTQGITIMMTALAPGDRDDLPHGTQIEVSSLMDVWITLANREANGERNRSLQIVKARGMRHSNQVREFLMSEEGIKLVGVSRQDGVVAIGSTRIAREQGSAAARRRRGSP